MPTIRETIFTALHARLSALPDNALRGGVLPPERVPTAGLIILRDGEPGEPEAVVEAADRDAAFDTLIASIGAALDRRLIREKDRGNRHLACRDRRRRERPYRNAPPAHLQIWE